MSTEQAQPSRHVFHSRGVCLPGRSHDRDTRQPPAPAPSASDWALVSDAASRQFHRALQLHGSAANRMPPLVKAAARAYSVWSPSRRPGGCGR